MSGPRVRYRYGICVIACVLASLVLLRWLPDFVAYAVNKISFFSHTSSNTIPTLCYEGPTSQGDRSQVRLFFYEYDPGNSDGGVLHIEVR